jgi:hypothetical protein
MAKKRKVYVYYDPDYDPYCDPAYDPKCTRNWIRPKMSKDIADFLEGKGFEILNADKLEKIMLSVVKREEKRIVVIVFAEDLAPDTVLNDAAPTALIRQYLDNGGSIIWVGDIPFWYQGRKKGQLQDNDWWRSGAPANILGVNPVFPTQISKAKTKKIKIERKTFELKSAWTGIRPVLIDKTIKVLAEAECPISSPYQPIPLSWFSRLGNRLSGIGAGVSSIRIDVKLETQAQKENILLNKRLANGWFKNYDADNQYSGFFRIWDYIPATLSNQQLEDLRNLANAVGGKQKAKR